MGPTTFTTVVSRVNSKGPILGPRTRRARRAETRRTRRNSFRRTSHRAILVVGRVLSAHVHPAMRSSNNSMRFMTFEGKIIRLRVENTYQSYSSSIIALGRNVRGVLVRCVPRMRRMHRIRSPTSATSRTCFRGVRGRGPVNPGR